MTSVEGETTPQERDAAHKEIYDQVDKYRREGSYRPGQAVVLYAHVQGQDGVDHVKYLLSRTTPRKGLPDTKGMWALHQGGIDPGQTLSDNLKGELRDELNVSSFDLGQVDYAVLPFREIKYDKPRQNKRGGDELGKAQIATAAEYKGKIDHLDNPSEDVAEAGWYDLEMALKLVEDAPETSDAKKTFMRDALISTSELVQRQ